MRFKRSMKAAGGFFVSAVGLAAGVDFAAWASGPAEAGTAQDVSVTAATGEADLYPGFAAGDVHFTATNPNPYDVVFDVMTAGTVSSSDPTNCPSTNVSVADATGLTLSVGGAATSGTLSIADVVSMDAAAPDACQGVSFSVALTLRGRAA